MEKDCLNILVMTRPDAGMRSLKIKRETFKLLVYLLAFFQLAMIFFFCDYIQQKKKALWLNQLREESEFQRNQIRLFSSQIEELEKKFIKLKELDQKIRIIANLQEDVNPHPFIGIGGSSSWLPHGNRERPPD